MNEAHSSLALCNFGAVDIRRATIRLVAWEVARTASRDIVVDRLIAAQLLLFR